MHRHIKILQRKIVFRHPFFRIEELRLQHELFSGSMSEPMTRLVLERGDSVAVLPHDPVAGVVLLCEQFRAPTVAHGPGWLIEVPAGVLEEGETSEACARRETLEETGYDVVDLVHITTVYSSPGGSSERVHIFYCQVKLQSDAPEEAGNMREGENIRILSLPLDGALARLRSNQVQDAKTVIALQWLELATIRSEVPGAR